MDNINCYLGGTIARQLIHQMLMPCKEKKKYEKFCGIWERFDKGKHRLVFPDITDSNHNVIDVIIDNNSDNYISQAFFYDSLERPSTRPTTRNVINPRIEEFLVNLIEVSFFVVMCITTIMAGCF